MLIGAHVLLYSEQPEDDRAFFRDVLGFPSVDAREVGSYSLSHPQKLRSIPPREPVVSYMEGANCWARFFT